MKLYLINNEDLAYKLAIRSSFPDFIEAMREAEEVCVAFDFCTTAEANAFLKGIQFCDSTPMVLLREDDSRDMALVDEIMKAKLIIDSDELSAINGFDYFTLD